MYRAMNVNASFWFKTMDCKVTEACESLKWAIGKDVSTVINWCESKALKWTVGEES